MRFLCHVRLVSKLASWSFRNLKLRTNFTDCILTLFPTAWFFRGKSFPGFSFQFGTEEGN